MQRTFPITFQIHYLWSGKFVAPSDEWMHMVRPLPEFELIMVTDGVLYIADESKKYQVNKNEYLLMAPTKKQYGYAPSNCTFFWMHFSVRDVLSNEEKCGEIPVQGTVHNIERMIILVNQVQDTSRRYAHQMTLNLLAIGILLELFNQQRIANASCAIGGTSQIVDSILNYIEWNKYQRPNVTEIADYLGYNEKYLSRIFKEHSGIALKRYILQEIMESAKVALMDSTKTIAQIGQSLGYTDPHNFCHSFKSIVGITPKEYRNAYVTLAKIQNKMFDSE